MIISTGLFTGSGDCHPGHLRDQLAGLSHDPDRTGPEIVIKLTLRIGHLTACLIRDLSRLRGETHDTPAAHRLTWAIDNDARQLLEAEIFGKRILVTDHDDWTVTEVSEPYCGHRRVLAA